MIKILVIRMNTLTLIGITGRKRSGKDTSGDYLCKKYGFVRVAFADALKEACIQIFGFSHEQVYGNDLKEVVDQYWGHSPREILQKVGTELFRDRLPEICPNIHNDIWIRSVERKINNLRQQGVTRFVVTDCRFDNELDFIKEYGINLAELNMSSTWKVIRPQNTGYHSANPTLSSSDIINNLHSSETSIDNFVCDLEFLNNQSIDDLYRKIDEQMNLMGIKPIC
jgi:hypothetical protein